MGQIQISNLTIEYKLLKGEGTFKAVDNVSLTVEAGELVTVVGSSGCGKSTIIGLLERFYDPQSVRNLIDDARLILAHSGLSS